MILGFSEGFHDAAIAIVDENGNIVHASHSERSSGVKHDKMVSAWQQEYVKQYDLSDIAFYERPLIKKTRQFYAGQYNTVLSKREMSFKPTKYYNHHLSHAAAAFSTSPYHEAACIVVDSIGEWDTVSIWSAHYDHNHKAVYKKVYNMRYPQSVGLWYSALTKYVGLKPLDEEYIFMGMAGFGEYNEYLISELNRRLFDSNNHRGIPAGTFGNFSGEDIAHNAQILLEQVLKMLFHIAKDYSNNICYGGGVALNCVANGKLMKDFSNVWIMPNPGDAGAALGAAALAYGGKLNWKHPYLGRKISGAVNPAWVAEYLEFNKVCGVANGAAEFGPRALGNRSLLADPRDPNIKDLMNNFKRRQMFRPFAPAILEEHANQYFDGITTRYMSTTARCKFPEQFPGIVHVDGSSRVQVVEKSSRSVLREILEAWYAKTGCPMLLNTSLNIMGKPMVDTKEDAVEFSKLYGVEVF